MGHIEPKCSQGYGKPPWIFRGSALYQLHLVKAETARAFIPKEFRLVEAFGYTLGGFFLASYDESPVGEFDELVVIAGIVWNPPTSCAWAAKVLVNSHEACDHGRKFVGLPSQVARFSKSMTPVLRQEGTKTNGILSMLGIGTYNPKDQIDVQVSEIRNSAVSDICNVNLRTPVPSSKASRWAGPSIKMSLPSFSGCTQYHPNLLKYSCQIECRVRPASPARVSNLGCALNLEGEQSSQDQSSDAVDFTSGDVENVAKNLSTSVMLSKPILALEFNCLKMQVEAPVVISHRTETSIGCV